MGLINMETSESALVVASQQGDVNSFARLVERYQALVGAVSSAHLATLMASRDCF